MPKSLTRIVSFTMVACIVTDPATASVWPLKDSAQALIDHRGPVFTLQAFSPRAEWMRFADRIGHSMRRAAGAHSRSSAGRHGDPGLQDWNVARTDGANFRENRQGVAGFPPTGGRHRHSDEYNPMNQPAGSDVKHTVGKQQSIESKDNTIPASYPRTQETLQTCRLAARLTLAETARAAGISVRRLNRLELGKTPGSAFMAKLIHNKIIALQGPRLKEWREAARLSGMDVVNALGRSRSYLEGVELGISPTDPASLNQVHQTLKKLLGAKLKERRLAARLDQDVVAAEIGMDPSFLSLIERGKSVPDIAALVLLHQTLDDLQGPWLRERREAAVLSRAKVAKQALLSESHLRKLEAGKVNARPDTVNLLQAALDKQQGLTLQEERRRVGLSQKQLGGAAGYSQDTVNRIESGKYKKTVSPDILRTLHKAIRSVRVFHYISPPLIESKAAAVGPNPEQLALQKERHEQQGKRVRLIQSFLPNVRDIHARRVIAHTLEGHEPHEIAQMLRLEKDAVLKMLRKGIDSLKETLSHNAAALSGWGALIIAAGTLLNPQEFFAPATQSLPSLPAVSFGTAALWFVPRTWILKLFRSRLKTHSPPAGGSRSDILAAAASERAIKDQEAAEARARDAEALRLVREAEAAEALERRRLAKERERAAADASRRRRASDDRAPHLVRLAASAANGLIAQHRLPENIHGAAFRLLSDALYDAIRDGRSQLPDETLDALLSALGANTKDRRKEFKNAVKRALRNAGRKAVPRSGKDGDVATAQPIATIFALRLFDSAIGLSGWAHDPAAWLAGAALAGMSIRTAASLRRMWRRRATGMGWPEGFPDTAHETWVAVVHDPLMGTLSTREEVENASTYRRLRLRTAA